MAFKLKWKQEAYTKRKHYIASVKITSGCIDCHIWGPDYILTFDHVRGEKLFGIGQRWDVSMKKLEEEITKCDVVCFNCHMQREQKRDKSDGIPLFKSFPKIPRLSREVVITEKIDGTNATIWIDGDGDVWAGSKNRWLSPENDNYGFAKWVEVHEQEFNFLGETVLNGEWWGQGIQRGYGLAEKRFSLFNVNRWIKPEVRPACCGVVPVIITGNFDTNLIEASVNYLRQFGSRAAPGYMNPEGIVIFHTAGNLMFKKTLIEDKKPKNLDVTN